MKIINKLLAANMFSFLVIGKFLGLILWALLGMTDIDYFGQYSLCLGLVSAFYLVAGMNGRLFVLLSVKTLPDYKNFTLLMIVFGIIATGLVVALNINSPLFLLLMLVAGSRFGDIFLLANISFIQNQTTREASFKLLNRHGWMVLIAFLGFLPFGLEYSVIAEIAVLLYSIFVQRRKIISDARLDNDDESVPSTMWSVLQGGFEFTMTSGLNSMIRTMFLYFVSAQYAQDDVYLIAKILAVQAIAVRIITSNNIFFKDEIEKKLSKIKTALISVSVVVWMALVLSLVALWMTKFDVQTQMLLLGVGAVFTVLNSVQTLIRQRVLIYVGPRQMALVHVLELVLMIGAGLLLDMTAVDALFYFTTLRLLRILIITRDSFNGPAVAQ